MNTFSICGLDVHVKCGSIVDGYYGAVINPTETYLEGFVRTIEETKCHISQLGEYENSRYIIYVNVPPVYIIDYSKLSETFLNMMIAANKEQCTNIAMTIIGSRMAFSPSMDQFVNALIEGICNFSDKLQNNYIQYLDTITIVDENASKIIDLTMKLNKIFPNKNIQLSGLEDVLIDLSINESTSKSANGSASGSASGSANGSVNGSANELDELVSIVSEDKCSICLSNMTDPTKILCGHIFCKECLNRYKKPICPLCKYVYNKVIGNQPDGTMTYKYSKKDLPGYNGDGHIIITYDMKAGIQTVSHPNPGKSFPETIREAYLPNNRKGKAVLTLLERAFDQKLIFTVGRSITSGRDDVITWNDIHHKTSIYGDYGYPDLDYLDRVIDELSLKGITL